MTSTTLKSDITDEILLRFSYWKFLIITSWIQGFLRNCKRLKLERQPGPLTTKEIESSEILWVKAIQIKIQDTPQFKNDTEKLNLQLDETHRIYICKGPITGNYPIYIPSNTFRKIGSTCSLKNPSRGTELHNDRGQRKILDSKVRSAHKTRNSQVLWT